MVPESGTLVTGFAAWLDSGHGPETGRMRHVRDVSEFVAWYDANPQDDVMSAARQFGEFGTQHQATSMRLLLEWLGQS